MIERGWGRIVNIASLASFVGLLEVAAYTASKSGVAGLTRALAVEWGPKGVNVNAIAPGVFRTRSQPGPARRHPARAGAEGAHAGEALRRRLRAAGRLRLPVLRLRQLRERRGADGGRRLPGQRRQLLANVKGTPHGALDPRPDRPRHPLPDLARARRLRRAEPAATTPRPTWSLETDGGLDGHGLTFTNGRGNELVRGRGARARNRSWWGATSTTSSRTCAAFYRSLDRRTRSCAGSVPRRASCTWRRARSSTRCGTSGRARGQAALEAPRRPDAGAARLVHRLHATSPTR